MAQNTVVDKLASQCVKCALCLPHCPTYELTKDENESPRGRIALFQALAQEKLPLTEKAQNHLDQCLGCRACERVCPAHVEYGQLLTLGRALIQDLPAQEKLTPRPTTRFLSWIVTKPHYQRFLHRMLWLLQITGLRRIGRLLKLPSLLGLGELDALLPAVAKPNEFQTTYEPIGPKKGSVKLFTGCITSMCDQETLGASIYVLRHLGIEVHVPKQQTCCGAIASHSGNMTEAYRLAKQNCDAFEVKQAEVDYIITTATGCSAVLQEYDYHFSSHSDSVDESLKRFSTKVIDIITFIQKQDWPTTLTIKPLSEKVFLHTPCTRRNVLKTPAEPAQLLARIPQLSVTSFISTHCCGAAGTYMLDHPQLAKPLADQLLNELNGKEVNFIATTNIGCALHLAKELKKTNPAIKVGHPVTLLAKALGF